MIVYFLVLLTNYLYIAHAATIPSTSSDANTLSIFDLASAQEPRLSSNNSTVGGKTWEWYCTPIRRWNQPVMEQNDCQGVLDYFYYKTMTDGGRKSMEFMSPGATKITHMKGQMTPRKYTFGTCTLAIIIIEDFPIPGMLPGGYQTGPPTDASSYLNLNRVAANLVEKCVVADGEAGWQPTGQNDGIGVFVWSTDSEQDREIENEKERVVFPTLTGSGSGSAGTS